MLRTLLNRHQLPNLKSWLPKSPTSVNYRPDIDALRAIAIILVLLFHLDVKFFSGGYIGVDIFFVISGYLITKKLSEEYYTSSKIDLKSFYSGRIKRLFPALFVTTLVTMLLSWFISSPQNFSTTAVSSISALTSLSNFWFLSQAGYWEQSSHEMPLLHTWSLSVEEQFYLFWPLLIIWLNKQRLTNSPIKLILIVAAISLLLSELFVHLKPNMAFYLMPFRIFEFCIGALCVHSAKLETYDKIKSLFRFNTTIFYGAITTIFLCGFIYNPQSHFPGLGALIPCLATGIVIITGQRPVKNKWIVNKFTAGIGLISYSLYLVHWPIITLYKQVTNTHLNAFEQVLLLACSVVASLALYRFVETPLRFGSTQQRTKANPSSALIGFFASSLCLMMSLAVIFIVMKRGVPNRFPEDVRAFAAPYLMDINNARHKQHYSQCILNKEAPCDNVVKGKTNVYLIGDSQAIDAYNAFSTAYEDVNFILLQNTGCPFIENADNKIDVHAGCNAINKARFNAITAQEEIRTVVLALKFLPDRISPLKETIDKLSSSGFRVILLGAGPQFEENVQNMVLKRRTMKNIDPFITQQLMPDLFQSEKSLKEQVEKAGGTLVSRKRFFCPNDICRAETFFGGTLNVFDDNHLTREAALEFGDHLRETYPDLFKQEKIDVAAR